MPDWLWWTGAAYLLIGVVAVVVIERVLQQGIGWPSRVGVAVGWLPIALGGVVMEVLDG